MAEDLSGRHLKDEVTPYPLYVRRRDFLKSAGLIGSVAATAGLYRWLNPVGKVELNTASLNTNVEPTLTQEQRLAQGFITNDELTSESDIISYNNFYEFTTNKGQVAQLAKDFKTDGWTLEVGGLVDNPRVFSIDDLKALAPLEERIYRMRCVEAWSMVIPWVGLPLAALLDVVSPKLNSRYLAFETLYDPQRMPGQKTTVLDWPYLEALRLDEARHPLTILAMGLYGKELPPQDGAPVRLVVPWKYGFKGIKSIVKITLTDSMPPTSWNRFNPREYGFYANVNPHVDHPRWSQATEQRIGDGKRHPTLMFNGYEAQVASLYEGMDLNVNI